MAVPYERIIQWVSGPFAVFIGGLAAKWVSSWGFLGQLGLTTDQTAKAITAAVVFVIATGVTILAHQKWMTNLAKWWEVNTAPVVAVPQTLPKLAAQTSPQPEGLIQPASPDQPNSAEWIRTRQSIADAIPMKDPEA